MPEQGLALAGPAAPVKAGRRRRFHHVFVRIPGTNSNQGIVADKGAKRPELPHNGH